jgi:uncharacterized protein YcfJ
LIIDRYSVPSGLGVIGAVCGGLIGLLLGRVWWSGLTVAAMTGAVGYFAGTGILKQFKLPSSTTTAEFKRFMNDDHLAGP